MRARILAAAAAATFFAAAPASAQQPDSVYRGEGYEVTMPAGCQVHPWSATSELTKMQPIDCGEKQRVLFVNRVRPADAPDTTRAARVAAFRETRQGMTAEFGSADALSAGTEFERPDRTGWRMDVQVSDNEQTYRGRAEISFARTASQQMWILLYLDRTGAPGTAATADRILDAFRLTRATAAPATSPE